jgi:hypothetical protein
MMSCGGWDEERMKTRLFEGRRALITGASSGVGLGVARAFAREGADLVITCRANVAGLEQAPREQQPLSAPATCLQPDLNQIAEVEALISLTGTLSASMSHCKTRRPYPSTTQLHFWHFSSSLRYRTRPLACGLCR